MRTQPKEPRTGESTTEELRQLDAQFDQEDAKLQERVDSELARLRAMGIIDEKGRRIKKDLPPDMREDSGCDLG